MVKQAENLSDSACMGNEERSEWGSYFRDLLGLFPKLEGEKNEEALMSRGGN